MEYAIEQISNIQEELQPLLDLHWQQIALNKDKIKLNPDWQKYIALNDNGLLYFYSAREDKKLVGYFVVTASTSMHYADHLFGICDIIFIHPDYRRGSAGMRLIKFAEAHLKSIGVSCIYINTKTHAPFDALLDKLQYTCIERVYSKYIGN